VRSISSDRESRVLSRKYRWLGRFALAAALENLNAIFILPIDVRRLSAARSDFA
jgi:hypothetical protein